MTVHRSTRSSTPSAGLLSFLATIAGFHPAHASPTPLSFLCPYIDPLFAASFNNPTNPRRQRSRTSSPQIAKRHNVPDKYEQGEDGRWRKLDKYTLYGSTVCMDNCNSPSSATPVVDETVLPSLSHNSSVSATPTKDVLGVLPSGWQPNNKPAGGRTTIILALSLVLAFFICGMMVGCIFWRRKRRRPGKDPDLEMTLRKKQRDQTDVALDKEIRVKAKIWARATARWKANARARQRDRRRHMARGTLSRTSSIIMHDAPPSTVSSHSLPPSPSLSSVHALSTPSVLSLVEVPNQVQISTNLVPPEHSDPPAYQRPQEPSNTPDPPKCEDSDVPDHTDHPPLEDHIPYSASTNAAHVATDDKNVLAQMADLASAPPGDNGEGQSSSREVSAPVWDDEEIDGFSEITAGDDDPCGSLEPPHCSSPPSLFPPPPSKGKMLTSEFYDYSYNFEEIGCDGAAPPFEEHAAIDPEMTPSAPPLEDNHEELRPSAPEGDLPSVARDPNAERAEDDLQPCDADGDTPRPPQRFSDAPLTPTLLRDGIPPIYQP